MIKKFSLSLSKFCHYRIFLIRHFTNYFRWLHNQLNMMKKIKKSKLKNNQAPLRSRILHSDSYSSRIYLYFRLALSFSAILSKFCIEYFLEFSLFSPFEICSRISLKTDPISPTDTSLWHIICTVECHSFKFSYFFSEFISRLFSSFSTFKYSYSVFNKSSWVYSSLPVRILSISSLIFWFWSLIYFIDAWVYFLMVYKF